MNRKNKLIIGLLAVAVVLYCFIQFCILPLNQAKKEDYMRSQTDALTHDISAVENYRTPYIGNASNVAGLFENLPLNNISRKFEINSDDCALTVNYLDTIWNIGEQKVQRDLIYNSVAAMAAIDNLSEITYNFSGDTYSFKRTEIEATFGTPLSNLLEEYTWSEAVQKKLNDADFVKQFFE